MPWSIGVGALTVGEELELLKDDGIPKLNPLKGDKIEAVDEE